jgi:hypothetical protein
VIEPPDILLIFALKVVPKPPHRIEPFDGLIIRVLGTYSDQPIADAFASIRKARSISGRRTAK